MKMLFDLATIIIFFTTYKFFDMYIAVASAMVLYSGQTIAMLLLGKKIDKIQWATLGLILALGSATFLFHNELFFKWKPTLVYILFAGFFLGSLWVGKQTILERMLGETITLAQDSWRQLTVSWAVFFVGMGVLNLVVAYNFDTDTWVNFKLFGIMGITLIFMLVQALYLMRQPQAIARVNDEEYKEEA